MSLSHTKNKGGGTCKVWRGDNIVPSVQTHRAPQEGMCCVPWRCAGVSCHIMLPLRPQQHGGVFQEHDQFCTHTFLQNPTDLKATLTVYFLFRIGREGLHVFHGRCRNLGDQAPAETGISTQPCNPVTFCNLCIVCLQPAGQQSWLLGTNGTFFQ